jgi:phosphomannomutase
MIRQEFAKFPMDIRDGVKVVQPDGWFLVRGSNTEPIIRIVAEGQSEVAAREKVTAIINRISGLKA